MNWAEAMKAFEAQVPVIYHNPVSTREPIQCTRIAEIAVRIDLNGNKTRVVAGMDRNENCLYKDTPEYFRRA